ncbi:SLAP domain-containing protein [Lactobacillus sp. ESL0681]|nr:SLAP domain-containing protein [Lactobacillus sp. ESL0681]WEV41229.1 SLAP domain-containing protein [Lactobacillus sp. ESL0681]
MTMKKLIAALALAASIAAPATVHQVDQVAAASSINEQAKQNSYSGVTYLYQMLEQEGIVYNCFYANGPLQYRNGKPEGVVIHETATPGASAHDEAIYFNREWMNMYSYVHAFVDKGQIIQMMTPNYGVWGAGANANNRFFQVELCEESNQADFAKGVNNDAIYVAKMLHRFNLEPDNAVHDGKGTIWSHHAVSNFLGGTDHTDPDGYFAKFGYSMDQFYDLIKYYYDLQTTPATDPATDTTTTSEKPEKPTEPVLPAPIATKTLMHDAIIYDADGLATDAAMKKPGNKLTIYGDKTINNKKYLQIGSNQYVVASNVEGRMRKLTHNAYLYNNSGSRIGYSKLYSGNSVRTYGGKVKIGNRKYYPIDVNEYVKAGNFK